MIVAERKPFPEIQQIIQGCRSVLVLGCGTCTSVCMAGGEKEVELLATQLRMANELQGKNIEVGEMTIQRQCDREYIEPLLRLNGQHDAVLSMACGAGVQLVGEVLQPLPVFPALNTRFIGITEAEGIWAERCRACGNCLLADFGGICPVTRCSKSLLNGPCGGTRQGKCEADDTRDCAWELIYHRLKQQGKLDNIRKLQFRDFSRQRHPAKLEAFAEPAEAPVK